MLILRLGLFFAPALCCSLFHHRFLIESEQSAAAEVEEDASEKKRKKIYGKLFNRRFSVYKRDNEIAESDVVEENGKIGIKQNQCGNANRERNHYSCKMGNSAFHEQNINSNEAGCKKKSDGSAYKRVPETGFIGKLLLHEENCYADEELSLIHI